MSGCPIEKVHKKKTKKRDKLRKYLLNDAPMQADYGGKNKMQNGNGVSITTTPDYNFYKVLNPQRISFKNEIMNQISANKRKSDHDDKIRKADETRNARVYEKKMQIIEHLQQINRDKVKKSLRDDINWQIKQKNSRSY